MSARMAASLEEVRALEGKKVETSLVIDQHMIDLYCQCLEDNNPKWKRTSPAGLVLTPMISESAVPVGIPQPLPRAVDAGASWEILRPLRVGDTLHTTHEFVQLQDKSNEKGPRILLLYKSTHKNQQDEVVAVSTNSILFF